MVLNLSNPWDIPDWLEKKVRARDKLCAYCSVRLKEYPRTKGTPGDKATWEHIDNDEKNISESNIVLCCGSCNSSKSAKELCVWLKSYYCKRKNITQKAIMNKIVRRYLETHC